ncbi:MAG TPA: SDR family oxidoreductase [Solimonas sp.]
MKNILIVGATSAIAEATARCFAAEQANLFLVARSAERMQAIAADLRLRGAGQVHCHMMEACDFAAHEPMVQEAIAALGSLDGVLVAHGVLPDQSLCERQPAAAREAFEVNATSVISLCGPIAQALEAQGHGCLAVISSVAGDRGRATNYIYGAAKAAVTALCSGLRQRLAPKGVRVVTVKPGFVSSPMTAHLDRSGPLWSEPAVVARSIHRAMQTRNGEIYVPWVWWGIMLVIRLIPERWFCRMRI